MSLRVAVAAPFRQRGTDSIPESEFVVALSLDRDWFSPDQAKRLIDVATGEGLIVREDDTLRAQFDPAEVRVPDEFVPDESILQERTPFERTLDMLVDAGHEKREAVAAINGLQQDLSVTVEAAAVVYARRSGLDAAELAEGARDALRDDED